MKIAISAMLVLVGLLAVGGGGCVMKEKVIEVVVTGETCAEYWEIHDSPVYSTPAVVNYANEIDMILQDNDVDRGDIKKAVVTNAWYRVTDFNQGHDWLITGQITVARNDIPSGTAALIEYTNQSVGEALGVTVPATLNGDGVSMLNQALTDYINWGNPILTFTVVSGGVTPAPAADDPMIFGWEACIKMQIVVEEDVDLPELF